MDFKYADPLELKDINLNDLKGEYFLVGVFNSTPNELFEHFNKAKNFKVGVDYTEADRTISFDFNYQDPELNKPHSILSKYNVLGPNSGYLISPMATLMFKQYTGDKDLLIHFYDKVKGNIVLVQNDLNIAYFLSKEPNPSQEDFATIKIIEGLGLQAESYKTVNNSS